MRVILAVYKELITYLYYCIRVTVLLQYFDLLYKYS